MAHNLSNQHSITRLINMIKLKGGHVFALIHPVTVATITLQCQGSTAVQMQTQ